MINKKPYITVQNSTNTCWEEWDNVGNVLRKHIKSLKKKKVVVCVEANLGTYTDSNLQAIKSCISPNVTCRAQDIYKDKNTILQMVTNQKGDRYSVTTANIEDYFDQQKLDGLKTNIDFIEHGVIFIHGIGSSKIWVPDILIYSDMSRWEQLQRFRRNEISNIGINNASEPFAKKYAWNHFIDWPICDKLKRKVITVCDYFLETNNWEKPKLATGAIVRKGYDQVYTQPFFNAPFFDPELWDSNLINSSNNNFDWVFNCNLDKNNILLKLGNNLFESPAINLVYYNPTKLLGKTIYKKYGLELPIRFNFLDTLDEKDMNLYLYPGVKYFKDRYGIYHKQYENYYVMDAKRSAKINIGLQSGISREYFEDAALQAKNIHDKQNIRSMLNSIHIKKHDHLTIPEEALHSKGSSSMILRITTSPSIFELALFGEKGEIPDQLDELIKLSANLPEDVSKYLNDVELMQSKEGCYEILGPEENDEICLRRYWIEKPLTLETGNDINVLSLVEGDAIVVSGDFESISIHYTETFVVPAAVKEYTITPKVGKKTGVLLATLTR